MAREPSPAPPGGEPLLTRLLRRRADEPQADAAAPIAPAPVADPPGATAGDGRAAPAPTADRETATAQEAPPPRARIDPGSGKPIDELVDADMPALDSIGPDSDVRAFLGRNISPELRRQALRKLFHQPKFNVICLCAEYAENYNNFTPMGSIVPHDLKRQLALQAERLARRALEEETAAAGVTDPVAEGGPAAESDAGAMLQRGSDERSTKVLDDADELVTGAPQGAAGKPQRG